MVKILLIEDDIPSNQILKEYLEYEGYEVFAAFDGEQGYEQFCKYRPDLVITDIVMPERDGVELIMKMGIINSLGDLAFPCKVIAISGGGRIGGKEYLETAKVLGVDDILEKPFDVSDLMTSIENLLS